jgi:ATP-dependent protease Clp ATPase subunit
VSATACSFCGKREDEVRGLVPGQNATICHECLDLCSDILRDELESEKSAGSGQRQLQLDRPAISCSFCGRAEVEVHRLIVGLKVCVCDECIRRCSDFLAERGK